MVCPLEAFGVDFVDFFCAGRTGREPAVFGDDFEAADGGVVAGGVGQFGGDRFASQFGCGDLFGDRSFKNRFLCAVGRCVAAFVDRAAESFLQSLINVRRVLAGDRP